MKSIVLATTSKYKIGLFRKLGLPFRTAAPPFEETVKPGFTPRELAADLAEAKARSLSDTFPDSLIIGSDQVLALGSEIFTKPGTTERAVAQLLELCGKTHCLHSAFTLWQPDSGKIETEVVPARLTFYDNFSREYLRGMVEEDQSQDCVGGYKYERRGIFLMKEIETNDSYTIVGLPLIALIRALQTRGYFPDRFSP